jgi:tRNA A37 methylthiotransferase MiaB
MDTEQFSAPPLTTGGLKSYFAVNGTTVPDTDIELVHFLQSEEIEGWLADVWKTTELPRARAAVEQGLAPVLGFSCYTWNVAEFLEIIQTLRADCPGLLVVVGGPHVQEAEEFLTSDGIDVVILGEGELTFAELLDAGPKPNYADIEGLAYADAEGVVHRTATRGRSKTLDEFPSGLDVIELRDEAGNPRYERAAVETSRGCPFKCAFCEWGTGAIGTKMYQFSVDRFRTDCERLVEGGIHDIWLCDSNFGALKEDVAKARVLVDLRKRTGLPSTFATSWHKHHNARVQEIVLMMHENGLLQHYNLALQTLTPLALELSHRTNMKSNAYEPIAKAMSEAGISIATELIWGLPGDTLGEFESHLDSLAAIFPNINIFGYTLLPGTEFYKKREQYSIDAIPVAGYGRAKGEYVVGCHTFERDEGLEGYFLISAHIFLIRGYVMPLTTRLLALDGTVPVSGLLRAVLREIAADHEERLPQLGLNDRMAVYEHRADLYVAALSDRERMFGIIRRVVEGWLKDHDADAQLADQVMKVLELDRAFCPRVGDGGIFEEVFAFDAEAASFHLSRMESPGPECFEPTDQLLQISHPGKVGEVLRDPDGGSWMRGRIVDDESALGHKPLPADFRPDSTPAIL